MIKKIFFISLSVLLLGAFAFSANKANATHSWGSYHWARTSSAFTLKVGDNLSGAWKTYLSTASADWSLSSVLDTTIITGANKKNCGAVNGRIEVCNKTYGNNGWLGIAQIWVSGNHITKGVTKMNDTYFNRVPYNTSAWKQFVVCQEVGHTFGLNHQDENFSNDNFGTCMDYTSDPDGKLADPDQLSNEHPNAHDYSQLETIYAHLDSFTTLLNKTSGTSARGNGNKNDDNDASNPSEWGKETRKDNKGRSSHFERELGNGNKIFTFVVWAE